MPAGLPAPVQFPPLHVHSVAALPHGTCALAGRAGTPGGVAGKRGGRSPPGPHQRANCGPKRGDDGGGVPASFSSVAHVPRSG